MVFLRLFFIVAAIACLTLAGAYVFTRDRKYLRWAYLTLKLTLGAALAFFAVLFFEELWYQRK